MTSGDNLSECNITMRISQLVDSHSEREDMTTFILEYTRRELHCQDKWDTFLMSMSACAL